MQNPASRRLTFTLATISLLALSACGKKSLDGAVDRLVKAARNNDYDAFRKMSHPELAAKFPPEEFKLLSQTLNALGTYKDRTMKGIKARSGKVREGRYVLTFDKGKVKLKLTLVKGKLTAFLFSGQTLEKAMKQARAKAFAVFKVGAFLFLDANGKPKNNVYRVTDKIRFKMSIYGMKPSAGTLKLLAGMRVTDAGGKVVLKNPKFVDSSVPIKPGDPPVATVSGKVKLGAPGHYALQLKITDVHAGGSLEYTSAILVEK